MSVTDEVGARAGLPAQRLYGQVLVSRDPIVDLEGDLVGYQLVRRSLSEDPADAPDDGIGLPGVSLGELVGEALAFLPMPAGRGLPGDPSKVVLEISGPVTPDLVRRVTVLRENGYRTVVDTRCQGPVEQLLEQAWGARLDARRLVDDSPDRTLTGLGDGLVLLAEGVHTREEAAAAAAAGCTLAQGSLWMEPELVRAATLKTGAAAGFRLAGLLSRTDVGIPDIARQVAEQPALSVRLLRLAGSAAFGQRQVRSLAGAISLVGLAALERWVLLAAVAEQGEVEPAALVELLVPARMCELLSADRRVDPGEAFLVGLLASLSWLLRGPVTEHLEAFGLPEDVVSAVADREGSLGRLLADVLAWRGGDLVMAPGGPEVFATAWGKAVGWATACAEDL